MKVSIVGKGNSKVLVIEIPMGEPRPSSTGKTLVVASSQGNKATEVKVDGKNVTVGVNAYIKA